MVFFLLVFFGVRLGVGAGLEGGEWWGGEGLGKGGG